MNPSTNTWLFVIFLSGWGAVILLVMGCAISWALLELGRKRRTSKTTTNTTTKEYHNDNLADRI